MRLKNPKRDNEGSDKHATEFCALDVSAHGKHNIAKSNAGRHGGLVFFHLAILEFSRESLWCTVSQASL